MSLRVAYWTSFFEPEMEAFAGEVALLRRRFRPSVAWGMNRRYWVHLSRHRGCCLHPRLHTAFRIATKALEPLFHINHIFGTVGEWFYLADKKRRPTVLTVAGLNAPVEQRLLDRVQQFVVEYPAGVEHLRTFGIDESRIRLIFPPVDLQRFAPRPAPSGPFTIVFASSPNSENVLPAKGIPLLLEAARLRPRMRFILLWRPYGATGESWVRQRIAEYNLQNVEVRVGCWKDMAEQYNQAHVCAAPFTDLMWSKPAPNSIIEGLACGRPAVITDLVGLADIVRQGGAGEITEPSGEAIAESLDRLQANWAHYSCNARRLAERWFGMEAFLRGYERLYQEVLAA